MILYAAIDIQGGRCVRLVQGDFARATVYDPDPVAVARRWEGAGASWLHVVDLDAAAGHGSNRDVIERIARAVQGRVQVGGGMRDLETVERALESGVARVVIGTAAIERPEFVTEAVARFGERIAVGVDARGGRVAVHGWQHTTERLADELVAELANWGVARVVFTDIERDGTLTQPNWTALGALVNRGRPAIIASGGIASIDHLLRLRALGVEGAIVGRALYEGTIDLQAALVQLAAPRTGGASESGLRSPTG